MSTPYIRFMNGDMPFWDFVAEMGGPQHSQAVPGDGEQNDGDNVRPFPSTAFVPEPSTLPTFPRLHHPADSRWDWSTFRRDGHPLDHDSTQHQQTRHRDRHGRHERHGRRGRHGHEHEPAPQREGETNVNNGRTGNVPQATTEDIDMTPVTNDTATITLQDNEKTEARNGVDSTPVPDPEIVTPHDDHTPGGSSSSDSDSDSNCSICPRPHRHHRHGHRGPGGRDGRDGRDRREGRGGRGGRGGWGGRGGHHHPHPHPAAHFSVPHGGPASPRFVPFSLNEMPEAGAGRMGGGFDRRFGRQHGFPFDSGMGGFGMHGHGPRGFGMRGRGGRRGHGPQSPAPTFDDVMRAFARDPRLRGLGDTIGNVLRATSAFVNPDAAGNDGQPGSADAGPVHSGPHPNGEDVDFSPAADIYDHPEAYVVHVVLPGAKKEDVSLSWDAEASELQVAGVVTRDGDEKMLQALALAERNVGVFQRCLKLGTDRVDGDAISAKMQDGILVITVPKKVDETWTEVRKVDIL